LHSARELSSAGSEHLPYKQRVTGSNPVAPTEDDFIEFRKNIHTKYDFEKYEDNCWERVSFFMDELIFCFSTPPPYFFHSNFEDFKNKFERDFTEGNGL
jgi:hypothetical protein